LRTLTKQQIKTFAIAIFIPLFVGILAALITRGQMDLYKEINKPPLAPPAVLFPIVWSVLYILMGIGSGKIILAKALPSEKLRAILIYALQLFINFIWSLVFFNAKAFEAAFILIVILWYLIFKMIIEFYNIDKGAAILQVPYLLWVTFATYLTLAIALLNK